MKLSDLKNAGHWPTLLTAFLYFDYSFMVWTLLGYGFLIFASLCLLAIVGLTVVKTRWRSTWGALAGARI
jgi:hypothetical protein